MYDHRASLILEFHGGGTLVSTISVTLQRLKRSLSKKFELSEMDSKSTSRIKRPPYPYQLLG